MTAENGVDAATAPVTALVAKPAAQGISASAYSKKRRQLVSLIDQLRSAGASTEIDLPRIAVIGNQSAGKSSLVEAISGIKVPRDAGTCTRCPMEIRLRSSPDPWSCRVSLRFETDAENRPIETIREIPFGASTEDPNEDKEFFVKLSDEEICQAKSDARPERLRNQLSFSTNLVCVDVSGPVTDLAFLDLPGIISNADDTRDIELIETMVKNSISGNTLILLTVTMKDDFQNQKAVLLAKEADPEGQRTIGVLTKADTVQRGEHASWLELVEGRRHQLAHGFFVTKQPGTEDLAKNLTFQKARSAEAKFFDRVEPWNNLAPHVKRQLGTRHLIRSDIASSLASVRAALKDLPAPPSSDPVSEMHARLAALSRHLDLLAQGATGYAGLVQAKNREDQRFKSMIRATKPHFIPFTASKDEADARETWEETNEGRFKKAQNEVDALVMDLDQLETHIQEHKGREVPLNTPYGAKTSLMKDAMGPWLGLSLDSLERSKGPIGTAVLNLANRHFKAFSAELLEIASLTVSEVLEQLFIVANARIDDIIELESTPFTLNDHYFAQTRDDVLTALKRARQGPDSLQVTIYEKDHVSTALSALAAAGYKGVTADHLPRLLGPAKHEEALDAAAQTVAYWKIAYKRLVDDIPRIIDAAVIRPLPSAISKALLEHLVTVGKDEIERLMAEPAPLAAERAELNLRKTRLEEAKRVLVSFGRSVD
ncbi:hypothetical protein C6P46_001184 [Rhodotorula mucilaginosa]|uniref:P-loop containing nucleoside triphosphate hydrolase protein n=1 Tax=Rhodotorula mucilaginosa TaxID=5537 RepID=A0A9P6W4T7_RHOMI|nr:hypothetical protein C6P46_001184 [Rhodotorula mucilaginosa]TKA58020.1 hypothetical protein B0A53_00422 [Rhodotorula sp. CCFEE 5036]